MSKISSFTRRLAILAAGIMMPFLALHSTAGGSINQVHQRCVGNLTGFAGISGDEGLSGTFSGLHNNVLIVAGGTAFPEGKPWEGGTKHFSDAILVFERDGAGQLTGREAGIQLPFAVGEGASASTPQGVVCIGGQVSGGLSDKVMLLTRTGSGVAVSDLPVLPMPLKNPAAASIGSKVYVAGGEGPEGASDRFMVLDISRPDAGWTTLPALPLPMSGSAAVAQMDGEEISIFLIGGRARAANEPVTRFYSSVYRYRPSSGKWNRMKDIRSGEGSTLPLSMAAAAPVGASHIVVVGGDDGTVFNKVEKAVNEIGTGNQGAVSVRDSLWKNHPGFHNSMLIYNAVTDSWFDGGEWTGTAVAVTGAVSWGGNIIVTGGEIRPAVRTGDIMELSFSVRPVFGWLNYLVLVVYFGGMLMLGFYFMKREGDTNDFFKAGGRIPWWAAGISIFATTLSAITFIAIPAKSYASDWRMFSFNMAIILIAPVVIRYFLPFFRRFNFDTAYQYLEARFNRWVRWLASALFVFFMVSRIAIVLFLPSLALNAVTGFSVYWAIIIMGVVTIIYCTSGGIEAVVWGDVIQGFILLGGALIALIFMLAGVEGGLGGFMDISSQNNKFHTFDFRLDLSQPVFWVVMLGGLANTLISYTSDQSVVQRYMTTRDEKATGRSIWLNGFLSIPVTIIFFLLGTGLYAYYTSNPERMGVVNPNIDSVFPQFIVAQMPAGLAGLLIAAIFAAAMSTLSSNINSVAAVITSDFYKAFRHKSPVDHSMRIARWSGVIVGILGIGMALILATWNIASLWDQFNTFLGLLTGGLGGLFVMGIFLPRISAHAALTGVIGGLIVLILLKNNTSLSFLLYGFAGMSSGVILAWLFSFVAPNKKDIRGYTWASRRGR